MADRKISDLTALTTPAAGDYLPIIDISEPLAANKNKRITIEELLRGAPDGTAAAPSFAFESDGGNGFYLAGTDTIGASTNGVNRLTLSTSALTSTVPISATSFAPTSSTVPTNGVYLPAANSVALSTNGTGRLFIDSSGRIGINNSSMSSFTANGADNLVVGSGASSEGITIYSGTSGQGSITFADGTTGNEAYRGYIAYSHTADAFQFITAAQERLRITSAGNVGIGTSTPDSPLQVIGSTSAHFKRTDNGTSAILITANDKQWSLGAHSDDYFRISREGVGERLRITSAGLVGIGSSAPSNALTVKGAVGSNQGIDVIHSNGNTVARLIHGGTGDEGQLTLLDSNSTTVLIRGEAGASSYFNAGNVGIGTTSPAATLEVNGDTGLIVHPTTANTTGQIELAGTRASGAAPVAKVFLKAVPENPAGDSDASSFAIETRAVGGVVSEKARIDSSGRLLVGTSSTSGNNASLQVRNDSAGSVHFQALRSSDSAAAAPNISVARSRGTAASPTEVTTNDLLGTFSFIGYDGASWAAGATIEAYADGTWTDGGDTTDNPGRLVFSVTADGASSPTEQLRITSDRYVRLASGTGGIQFNGDTAAANALDDYEEGTFTPTIAGTSTAGTGTYSVQLGVYTKIGNRVFYSIHLDWTAHTGTGSLEVKGLPFTSANTANNFTAASTWCSNLALTAGSVFSAYTSFNSTSVILRQLPSGGGASATIPVDTAAAILIAGHYNV